MAEEMVVQVRLFAMLREGAGRERIDVRLPAEATVAEALAALAREPALSELIARMPMRMAVNRDYADATTRLHAGDELALIPPVSGGETMHVREQPLSLERLADAVGDPSAGAVVLFAGLTREVERLEYEAYADMADERIEQILRECAERPGVCRVAAEHRVGDVPLGEPSVVVAVSAAHREEAFAAAREAIDRIKAEAPIWKREHGAGAPPRWVQGTAPPAGEQR